MRALSSYYFVQALLTVIALYYLPLFLQHEGYTVVQVGLLVSAGAIASIVAPPLWGVVGDRWRKLKPLLLILLALSLAAGSLMFRMETLISVFVVYALFMFVYSPLTPLADTMAIAYSARRGTSYGSIRLWGSVGLSVGSLFFGTIFSYWGIATLPAVFATVIVLLIFVGTQLPSEGNHQVKSMQLRHLRELLSDRTYLGFVAAVTVMVIPFRMNDQLFSVYMKMQGATDFQIGLAWGAATLCSIPAYYGSGWLLRRYGETQLLVFAGWMFVLRWITLAWMKDPLWLILHQAMNLVTVPILYVAVVLQVSKLVPQHLQTTGQAVFTAVFAGVAGLIGSTVGGWGMGRFEPNVVYLAGGGLACIGTLLTMVWSKNRGERRVVHGTESIL
ncbi:MFS transporter [Paenibacillus qinlingensis]|uniref:PPP family 3-phenylpropionic acid transporter n=1 Tax=Paenibacillus qinlingensis TaxID=1837343 RepID=A0ABU1NWA7_9BACL|nr:MFS transporter [Paenibacillus qinlingensis]MDR6551763.1 PPP family 3-phenylpropionic acid transporter [Paenibacillus qinlingensis]